MKQGLRLFFLSLGIVLVATVIVPSEGAPLLAPQWLHPFGTDEFGRDVLRVTVVASGITLLKATYLTLLTLLVSLTMAFVVRLAGPFFGTGLLQSSIRVIESCPIVLWIFIAIVVLFESPKLFAVTLAFLIAVVPTVSAVLTGEYDRQSRLGYVEAARVVGVAETRIFLRYIMPNASAVVAPVIVNVFGAAMMIDGAIGLVGMGNRSELDLGVLVIRAKETFLFAPWNAVSMIFAFIYIFWGLSVIKTLFGPRDREDLTTSSMI